MRAYSENTGSEGKTQRRPHLALSVILGAVTVVFLLIGLSWAGRHVLLREAATLWIVSDSTVPADAAVVFGGGLDYRPFAAAQFYLRGLVPKILVSNTDATPAERLGVVPSHLRSTMQVLEKLGVPGVAIQPFGSNLRGTYEEALALHDWAKRNGAHTILLPIDIFAARRLRWIMHRIFGNDAVVLVPAVDPPEYTRKDWWKTEGGLIAFQNEVLKYAYYRLKY